MCFEFARFKMIRKRQLAWLPLVKVGCYEDIDSAKGIFTHTNHWYVNLRTRHWRRGQNVYVFILTNHAANALRKSHICRNKKYCSAIGILFWRFYQFCLKDHTVSVNRTEYWFELKANKYEKGTLKVVFFHINYYLMDNCST